MGRAQGQIDMGKLYTQGVQAPPRRHTALLVVDALPTFMPGGELPVPDGDAIIGPIAGLIHSGKFPFVVFVREQHPPDHCSFSKDPQFTDGSWPSHGVAGTPNAEVHPALIAAAIQAGVEFVVISKGMERDVEAYSAFDGINLVTGRTLTEELRAHCVKKLVACGLAGEICVKDSILAGIKDGFDVSLFEEGTRFLGPPEKAIAEMRSSGAHVDGENTKTPQS